MKKSIKISQHSYCQISYLKAFLDKKFPVNSFSRTKIMQIAIDHYVKFLQLKFKKEEANKVS